MRVLPFLIAGALAPASLLAQSNATSTLVTFGDVINGSCTATLSNATSGVGAYIIPSLLDTGSNYLVGLSGDPNDLLAVGLDLASGGTYFQGNTNAQGRYSVSFNLVVAPSFLDRKVYWQGFTQTAGPSFQDFSNLRVMTLNNANRWQAACTDAPQPSANLGFVVSKRGANNRATEVFVCGGGPALLTDPATPYHCTDKAWIYDVLREQHTELPGGMNVSRAFHNAVRLNDGRIMVVGGVTFGGQQGSNFYTVVLNSCEVYDPLAQTWTLTPPMSAYRAGATANLLPDGRVFVAGGTEGDSQHRLFDVTDLLDSALRSTAIYDPVANTWSAGPDMPGRKAGAGSIVLNDGRVLIAGGITYELIIGIPVPSFSDRAFVYNPSSGAYTSANMQDGRALFGITLLNDGRVLCAGGGGGDILNIGPIRKAEIYNPANNTFTATPNLPNDAAFPVAVTLADGRAMVLGGATGSLDDPIPTALCSIYNPTANTWTAVDAMDVAHGGGAGAILEDGSVYYSGGETNNGQATNAAENYTP
ncbi:MAG: hypothetical protein EYC70_11620 [Planctomycetota bacterium]|nr:MAG: hypothetical protein EYC70_11620 [Planctomycetota bacterium]